MILYHGTNKDFGEIGHWQSRITHQRKHKESYTTHFFSAKFY